MSVVGIGSGRIDMMGGVGDYSGSLVLQVATERATTVTASLDAAAPSGADPAGSVELSSEPFGTTTLSLALLRSAVAGGAPASLELKAVQDFLKSVDAPSWTFYVYGSIAVFVRETGWLPPADRVLKLHVTSTVPAAQGVSSSASIEVATLRAMINLSGVQLATLRLAHIAQAAENFVVGAPCGLMDQLASAFGKPGQVLPILCRPDDCAPTVPLPPAVTVVGWPSGVKHSVAASPYLTARTATFMGKKILEGLLGRSVAHVSSFTPEELAAVAERVPEKMSGADFLAAYGGVDDGLSKIIPETVYDVRASVSFPILENDRCLRALDLLRGLASGKLAEGSGEYTAALTSIGSLMGETHKGYNSIGLGAPETDLMIEKLVALGPAKGIYGARVSGGGSGGTVAVLCERSALPLVEQLGKEITFGEAFTGLIN